MKSALSIAAVLLAIAGGTWAEPPQPGKGQRGPGKARSGPGHERGEAGTRGERRGPQRGGEMAARMMQALDRNRDGTITFAEFAAAEKMAELPEEAQRKLFARFDKNQDGKIERRELPQGGRPAGMGRPGDGFRKLDTNADHKISREEFLKSPRIQNIPVEKRKEIFTRMDRNKDGVIDARDHHRGPRPGGGMPGRGRPPMDPSKFRAELDKNKDGSVDFKEFGAHPRFGAMPEDQRKELFGRMDRNGDRKLDDADIPEGGLRERVRPRPDGGAERREGLRGPKAPDA